MKTRGPNLLIFVRERGGGLTLFYSSLPFQQSLKNFRPLFGSIFNMTFEMGDGAITDPSQTNTRHGKH